MGAPVFRDRVVGHYVGRGYRVDTDPVVTGEAGGEYRLGLMATDDLGRIAVWWGDQEPFEGPELESLRRAARDMNAAPAIALPQATNTLRDHARKHGVVIVDDLVLEAEAAAMARPVTPPPVVDAPSTPEAPAWPDPDRVPSPRDTVEEATTPVQAPWKQDPRSIPDPTAVDPDDDRKAFDWLGEETVASRARAEKRRRATDIMPPYWKPLLYGTIMMLLLVVLVAILL